MGPTALRVKKNIHRQNHIKPRGSWRYIEVFRHETIGLCKKLNSIYIFFLSLIHRDVQLSWACSQQPMNDVSTCSGIVDMRGSDLNNEWRIHVTDRFRAYKFLPQTDCFVSYRWGMSFFKNACRGQVPKQTCSQSAVRGVSTHDVEERAFSEQPSRATER